MCEKIERQINQLFLVSEMYFNIAQGMRSQLDEKFLKATVNAFSTNCENEQFLLSNRKGIQAVAHLSSSAIRLYSIDEALKNQSTRWVEYNRIISLKDKTHVKNDITKNIASLIHFLLRHMVAHSEAEWRRFKKFKIAYEAMSEYYFELNYQTIFQKYNCVIKDVFEELKSRQCSIAEKYEYDVTSNTFNVKD